MLTKRLQKIFSVIPRSGVVADVGCDHGYVGIEALESGVADSVIFVDISNECLKKARKNCPAGSKDNASFVCRDGLGDLQVDAAVICGMGGLEIVSILKDASFPPRSLVLQPMRNQYDVRKYLTENGYEIVYDEKFFDGKYYDLLAAERSENASALNELELTFGKQNLQNATEDFLAFLRNEENKVKKILLDCDDAEVAERRKKIETALAVASKNKENKK